MKRIEIVYDAYAERVLNSSWEELPKELEMIISLAYCIQNMCVGNGKNWDGACPKWLRGILDKNTTVGAFRKASRLLAIVTLNPMFVASVTLRFFGNRRNEKSFHEVTVNLSRAGKAMAGVIRTTQQLFSLYTFKPPS
ncbi:MAG: hypothetical protein HY432_01080 [Candidatus Liptonbacteria bacterium]|nr:hypothetical protein [Candidatus Liptonbacteria bacterium]